MYISLIHEFPWNSWLPIATIQNEWFSIIDKTSRVEDKIMVNKKLATIQNKPEKKKKKASDVFFFFSPWKKNVFLTQLDAVLIH